ncbi:hypothetical protein FOZ63_014427 [Perkinsus olseni]|uniref:Uncharacterized protein n=1 Tax=Perkinsus olseni TaxID=32597 RepID=A0A7J6QHV5_PEROL|nr:hypothetical protein FOZ63_014427 [Perkinsus olseni]
MSAEDLEFMSSVSVDGTTARPSATALFRQKAKTQGFLVPNEDPVQVLCNSLQFSTSAAFSPIRQAWRCANVATLAKDVKYWIDDSLDLTKCSSCELQAFIQKGLSTMEFEYEFTLPVITMVVILWLTDVNAKDHIRRTLVVSTLHDWFLKSSTETSGAVDAGSEDQTSSTSVDYYTTTGYAKLISASWESCWTDIFSAVMHDLMQQEEYTLDVNTLRIDWLRVQQRGRSVVVYLADEKDKFDKYGNALHRLSIPLPSDYDRVVNLVKKADQGARNDVSKRVRDKHLSIYKISYSDCCEHSSATSPKSGKPTSNGNTVQNNNKADKKDKVGKKSDSSRSSKPPCKWCHRRSHTDDTCWYNPANMGTQSSEVSSPTPESSSTSSSASQRSQPPTSTGGSSTSANGQQQPSLPSPPTTTPSAPQSAPPKKNNKGPKQTGKPSSAQGPMTRSQTGKLPPPTATTFAVGNSTQHVTSSLMAIDMELSSLAIGYECIVDTASVHTLVGPSILALPGIEVSPCNGQVSVFNGQSLSFSQEVTIPAHFPGITVNFNIKAYVCSSSMLSSRQLLLGIGTLSRMKAEINITAASVCIGALQVTVPLRTVSTLCATVSVLPVTTTSTTGDNSSAQPSMDSSVSYGDDADDIAFKFKDFVVPVADYEFQHHHPVLRPKRWNTGNRQQICSELLHELQQQGVIAEVRPDDTMHFAQALAVPKKGKDEYRLVVDFRAINKRLSTTQPIQDLLPYVDSPQALLQSIPSTSRFYSCLDISSAYHCIPLSDRARLCTGVTDGKRYFLYNRLAQGHKYSSYWWCYSLKCVLARAFGVDITDLAKCGVAVYVDDIVCFADTLEDCQAKVAFVTGVLNHLGWLTNDRQWFLSEHHLKQVRQLRDQIPRTPNDLRTAPYSKTRRPEDLNDIDHDYLLGNDSVLVDSWSECYHGSSIRWPIHDREAYSLVRTLERYKHLLISTIPPINHDSVQDSAHFVVLGDNSVTISSFRQLNFPADGLRGRRWISWYERIWPLTDYRVHYKHIAGETNFLSDAFSRIISDLVPIPSSDMVFAVLEGNTVTTADDSDAEPHHQDQPVVGDLLRAWSPIRRRLATLQKEDTTTLYCGATLASLYDEVQQLDATDTYNTDDDTHMSVAAHNLAKSGRFIMDSDGLLLIKVIYDGVSCIVPIIPDGGDFRDLLQLPYVIDDPTSSTTPNDSRALTARQFFVWLFHDGPVHIGRSRTYVMARRHIWFPNMSTYVRSYIRRCPTCAPSTLPAQQPTPLAAVPLVSTRFKHLAVDHVDPRKAPIGELAVILSIVDLATTWVCFVSVRDHSALAAAEAIYTNWVASYGWPLSIQSDNHQSFSSKLWEALGLLCGLRLPKSTPYYAPGNGAVERKNKDLRSLLSKFDGHDRWDLLSKLGQMVLNTTTDSEYGLSAASLVLGTKDISPTPIELFIPNISADALSHTINNDDQFLHLQQLRQEVVRSVDSWMKESILMRTDARAREADRRNASSSSSTPKPLTPGQPVFYKPKESGPNLRRGKVSRCLNPDNGVYEVIFDDELNKHYSINGRFLVPFEGVDHRELVLRFFSNPNARYETGDILVVNFADNSNRFYFAEFKEYATGNKIRLQPQDLEGARLSATPTTLLADTAQVNPDIPPFRLQSRRLIPRAVLQRLVTLGFNLQQAN